MDPSLAGSTIFPVNLPLPVVYFPIRYPSEEVGQLRTLLGALSWVAKETRPDIAGKVAMLQQSRPSPAETRTWNQNSANPSGKVAGRSDHRPQLGQLRRKILGGLQEGLLGRNSNKLDPTPPATTPRILFHPGAAPGGPDLYILYHGRE